MRGTVAWVDIDCPFAITKSCIDRSGSNPDSTTTSQRCGQQVLFTVEFA